MNTKLNMIVCIVASLVLLTNSSSNAQYKLHFTGYYKGHKVVYKLSLPQSFSLSQGKDYHGQSEKVAHFKDSSVFYITDALKHGGSFNSYKISKYGNHYELKLVLNDTATLFGTHNEKYWKECKYYTIVAGYYDASAEEQKEYDKIIDSMILQVDRIRSKFKQE